MANATTVTGTTIGARSSAYKAVPEHATSAISSGLDRFFGTPTSTGVLSRENSASSADGEWEVIAAERRHKARGSEEDRREPDEYLEEPLETFSRTERVDGIEQRVVFDLLAYWQVRTIPPTPPVAILTSPQHAEKKFPNLFYLAMDVLPAQASSAPCERLFSSGKETCTARRNRIRPKLMEALQALKLSSRTGSLNLTAHLLDGFCPQEDNVLEACEVIEAVCDMEADSPHRTR